MAKDSLDQVLGNTDLLTKILVLFPPKPIITLKTVSKFWFSLISDREFQITHTRRHPPSSLSGFYYQNYYWSTEISPNSIPKIVSLETKSTEIKILNSCNGLILCHNRKHMTYDVFNPTTQNYRLLPEPLSSRNVVHKLCCFLAFDPSKSCHYKVIHFKRNKCTNDPSCASVTIDIFSSESESCKEVRLLVPIDWTFGDSRVVFWNGALNWISKELLHIQFIVDEEKFTFIHVPEVVSPGGGKVGYFGECGDSLLLVKFREEVTRILRLFEMDKNSNSWALKIIINIGPLVYEFPEMLTHTIDMLKYSVLSVKSEANKDNLSYVLGIPGKIISYSVDKDDRLIISKTKVLGEFPNYLSLSSYNDLHPFIHCLTPV